MGAFKRMFITRGTKLHWITLVFSGIMLSFVIFEHSRLLGGTPSIQQSPRITLDNTNNIRKSHLETEEEEEFSRLRGNPDFEEYLNSAGFTMEHFKGTTVHIVSTYLH